jgi:hypothetical protein
MRRSRSGERSRTARINRRPGENRDDMASRGHVASPVARRRPGNACDANAKPFINDCRYVLSRVHWVRPELVAEVKYLTWTEDNLLRQVVYEGLREDKPTSEVRRADAAPEAPRGGGFGSSNKNSSA